MPAPVGNEFWKARSSHGRAPIFASPDALWDACCQYFEWVEANPLHEAKPFAYEGNVTIAQLPKMRAMTLVGLCIYLDIGRTTWDDYSGREGFTDITTRAQDVIRTQKFEGAAAGLLAPNLIAREIGLTDKSEIAGAGGGPLQVVFHTIYEAEPER